jgi:myosin V
LAYLEKLRGDRLHDAVVFIQKYMLRNLYRKRYLLIRNGMIVCQAQIRGVLARRRAEAIRREHAATTIQAFLRGRAARARYQAIRKNIIQLQAGCRGFLIRRNYRQVREEKAAVTIQRCWRGSVERRKYLGTRHKIVLAQCCVRRRLARKQLKTLREEARSISHIKEVSYQLENKVIDLTQNLAKRTQENKQLLSQLSLLESQLATWQERHSTLQERADTFERDAVKANDAIAKSVHLEQELKALQERQDETQRNLDKWEQESADLKKTLLKRSSELEEALNARDSAEQARGSLNQEIQSLKMEVERLSQGGAASNSLANGLKTPSNGKLNGLLSVSTGKRSNRTPRRRSYVDGGDGMGDDLRSGSNYNPRPASMAFSPAALQKHWLSSPGNGIDMALPHYENIDAEVCRAEIFANLDSTIARRG